MKRFLVATALLIVVLASGGVLFLRLRFPPPPPPPTEAELAQLIGQRAELQERFRELTLKKDDEGFAEAPKGGVLIGIPTSFTRSIVEQMVTGLLGEVRLTLKNIKVHKADDVRAKLVFAKRTMGSFVLDLDLHQIHARLKPDAPTLTFGGNRIGITLPVTAADSHATATIRFQWDSRGLANLACGNLDVTRDVDGSAVPTTYVVRGYFDLATDQGTLLADPEFGELRILVKVAPSEAAWKVVDDLIAAQEGTCGSALRKIDVKEKIAKILDRGFNVKLPAKLFRPIRLPAGIRQSMELQGVQLLLEVKPTGLSVAKKRIWYGADIATHRGAAPTSAPTSAPSTVPSPGPSPRPAPSPTPAAVPPKEKP